MIKFCRIWCKYHCYLKIYGASGLAIRRGYVIIGVFPSAHMSVCLFFCEQRNSQTYWWIFFKYPHIVHICLSKSWLNFAQSDVNVTVAYCNAPLKFMGRLAWQGSTICECNFLVFYVTVVLATQLPHHQPTDSPHRRTTPWVYHAMMAATSSHTVVSGFSVHICPKRLWKQSLLLSGTIATAYPLPPPMFCNHFFCMDYIYKICIHFKQIYGVLLFFK